MRIDIHCHTFNASDISVREFLKRSRFADGILAEVWYGLPEPLKNAVARLLLAAVEQGPRAAEERIDLLRQRRRKQKSSRNLTRMALPEEELDAPLPEPDLDLPARRLLVEAFHDPDDRGPVFRTKSLRGVEKDAARVPNDDEVFALLVNYAFRAPPRQDVGPAVEAGGPALLRWATLEQEAISAWIPTVPVSAQAGDEFEQEVLAAWTRLEAENEVSMEHWDLLLADAVVPGSGRSWIHLLVRKAERWAQATGNHGKEAVLDFARFLGRRIRAAKEAVKSLLRFIRLLESSRQSIVQALVKTYRRVDLFTPALVDYTAVTRDCPGSVLIDQVGYWETFMKHRAQDGAAPLVHPFFPFDPYWLISDDYLENGHARLREELAAFTSAPLGSLDEMVRDRVLVSRRDPDLLLVMRYAIERAGFIGIKLYPPAMFAPYGNARERNNGFPKIGDGEGLDLVLLALYRYCAENDVPILAHASAGNAFEKEYGRLAGPTYWADALAALGQRTPRPLRLCLGHFGHFYDEGISMGWGEAFAKIIHENEFVYGDVGNSHVPGSASHGAQFLSMLKALIQTRDRLPARLLYGSDWMLNNLHDGHGAFFDAFHEMFQKDPDLRTHTDDFLGGNAVRFLFLDAQGKPNRNHDRLRDFYARAGATFPEVLARVGRGHHGP